MLVEAIPMASPPERPLSGWVLAASVLLAVRLGRSASEAARFDMAHLQATHLNLQQHFLTLATNCHESSMQLTVRAFGC